MNNYWTTTSTSYIPSWHTISTYGKVSIKYIIKK